MRKSIRRYDGGDDLPLVDTEETTLNPFVYDSYLTWYERFKIIFMCFTLIPLIRLVLLVVLTLIIIIVANVGTLGFKPTDPFTKEAVPIPAWRRAIMYPNRWLLRATLFVLGYYWIPVIKPKSDPNSKRANIIVSNHVTFLDGPYLASNCNVSVALMKELGSIPLIGGVIRSLSPILVDRHTPEGRKRALEEIKTRPASGKFPPLLIFPEGITSRSDNLTKFKRGPFTPGLPVQPVVLKYPFRHFDVSWTGFAKASYLIGRMLCQFYNRMEVHFLPVYVPNDAEKKDPELFADNVRNVMASYMNVPVTEHSMEDTKLLCDVGLYAAHIVDHTSVGQIKALTSMSYAEVASLVRKFKEFDDNSDGFITQEQMRSILLQKDDAKASPFLTQLFLLLDNDGNGQIDFRELCLGLSALSPNLSREDMVQFSFNLYGTATDTTASSNISRKDLAKVLNLSRRLFGLDTEAIDRMSQEFKGDEDGRISFSEFIEMTDRRPELIDTMLEKSRNSLRSSFRTSSFRVSDTFRASGIINHNNTIMMA